jgi:metallo-beta-lactamase family protein
MAPPNGEAPVLQFLGATGTVTGSRFLVETARARVLVDCGLFQGVKQLRLRNWEPFPVDPASLDAVLLTHAHVDHCGYLPALVRGGLRAPIFATRATGELCRIVLPDSAKIQEEDAAFANRKGFSKHRPAQPLYTRANADAALARFRVVPFEIATEVAEGVRATFRPAGHILGSATITLEVGDAPATRIAFSGDLGRPNHPILNPPAPLPGADALVIESTYGDRSHVAGAELRMAEAIAMTAERGGVSLIPAFAVDRTEMILLYIKRLMASGSIPRMPIYVDSPMAVAALAVYRRAIAEGDAEIRPELRGVEDPFDPGELVETRSVAASKEITSRPGPAIIVSASGMATGGRVLHHLAARLPDPRNAVLLVGFQAQQTRGRRLLEGARMLKMHGRYVPVHARIVDLTGFSVHVDRDEMLAWLRRMKEPPECCYVVHGEPKAGEALRGAVDSELGWNAVVPSHLERVRAVAV